MIVIKNKRVRDGLKILIPFVAAPTVVGLGTVVFDEKRHLFVSFAVAILAVILFLTGFEKKKLVHVAW